jgi:hypothetical protein
MVDNNLNKLYDEVINIDREKLVSYLTCFLCKGIFRTPYTINECMHIFCKSCIFKHFYRNQTNDSCPECGMKLGGRPLETLIFDSSINVLVETLFPEFNELDREANVIYR